MKKLLVTAIGAAAAFGAVAGTISTQRFESVTGELPLAKTTSELNTLAGGTYWSGDDLTNKYNVVSAAGEDIHEGPFGVDSPTKALGIKTTFGSPLTVKAIAGANTSTNIPASGIYFDSLVKFTVCEDEPDQTYPGAKIVMWLQEQTDGSDNILGTNIMVRASYANADGTFTPTNFVCKRFNGSIDAWYRVTIKTWASILNNKTVPGFAIFIDGDSVNVADEYTMADEVAANLTEAAGALGKDEVFPSLVQGEATGANTITSASFDGTGWLTDLVFTDEAPFAAAEDYVAPKAYVTVGALQREFGTLAEAIAAVNEVGSGTTVTFSLAKTMVLDAPIVLNGAGNIVFDFAGFVLTNAAAYCAITNTSGAITFIDSGTGGGITCTDPTATAIYVSGGTNVTIAAGTFRSAVKAVNWSTVLLAKAVHITGGSFEVKDGLEARAKSEGKMFELNELTGLYDVVDARYTVKFISGEGSTTNEYTDVVGEEVTVPTPAAVVGKTFSAWDPAIAGATVTVSADATYTAQYTNNIYTITFVIGESSSSVQKEYGSEITSVPEIPVRIGYTGAWDDDPAGDTVTGDKTYTYTYSAETYTITFVNAIGADPASTNYTIESGAITLPTATTENTGVEFDGWTNATITAAIKEFTPTTSNVGSFTLYAAWESIGPVTPTINPADPKPVEITAASKQAAIDAVAVPAPSGSGIDTPEKEAAYKALFNIEANNTSGDTWEVELTGIKETVEQAVTVSAENLVSGSAATGTIAVPAGLYYKITPSTGLPISGTPVTGLSNGATKTITKPTGTQGFIKVEMGTVEYK